MRCIRMSRGKTTWTDEKDAERAAGGERGKDATFTIRYAF